MPEVEAEEWRIWETSRAVKADLTPPDTPGLSELEAEFEDETR